MMWETSALPRNGRLPAVGGGREAMANNAHGVDVRKNREAPVSQKKMKKKSQPIVQYIYIRVCMYYGNDNGKIVKPAVVIVVVALLRPLRSSRSPWKKRVSAENSPKKSPK